MDILNDISIAAPEALLIGVALIGVLLGATFKQSFNGLSRLLGALALAGAAFLAASQSAVDASTAFNGLYKVTPFIAIAKAVSYGVGAIALLVAGGYLHRENMNKFEYTLLVMFGSAGMGVMLSANNLMTLYMGIETLSLSSYVLAAFNRDSRRSAEAGLKYFVLGALASGLLLFGCSLVYGYTGFASFEQIAAADQSIGLTFGLVLILMALSFKASAAPFHVWTPDVYEGAPTPVVTFFSTAPKLATVAVLANIMFTVFGVYEESWMLIIAIVSAISMLVGAFGGLAQNNIKRLLAYSSIANVGYALMGVAAGEVNGAASVLTYMTIYVITTLGMFGIVLAMRRRDGQVEEISDLNGLSTSRPGLAVAMTVLVFSVAGIPPMAGFLGKWVVFEAALKSELYWLVAVGVIGSVVSLGYYLRLIWAMWAKTSDEEALEPADGMVSVSIYGATILAFPVLVIWIGWMTGIIGTAAAAG
ncbi:NADH-quinone oxidoreductase subunit N [Hirschia baltica]|uniref:NADH-quinone oxidoreductase subunit N n=1 Tax=Hirschia baltica (strain ATCC 49814 / DSM 5838 / IFAM 1418) TaxID=582402 RepID=NUON_HIRBI|nr:NADH-quinone oxidoreductase subunit N [Hirschia baltica]C6XJX0.1 RecName: Full=NADH-quinone oxidoreductase subunit N; AltName: Full=NADH dehydrogenase I subunit N; AltName: Full=NDH-1 subunit N [Hirschia baltica ATCC 49814]ACT59415.1 proton-translocating NADH-quinone oxidoreductase, chain N [Hirschia baltica ATCC 49814]